MKKYKCLCCGYITLETRGVYDICPVCFWEDDAYLYVDEQGDIKGSYYETNEIPEEILMDIPSGANHGLTLREGRENYKKYKVCEKSMKKYVRKPKKKEYPKDEQYNK